MGYYSLDVYTHLMDNLHRAGKSPTALLKTAADGSSLLDHLIMASDIVMIYQLSQGWESEGRCQQETQA